MSARRTSSKPMLRVLTPDALPVSTTLLTRCLPRDRIDLVCTEKLFGDDGVRQGRVVGAFDGDVLLGVLAQAGRFVKILAVAPEVRRRGIATLLLDDAAKTAAGLALRMGDHPGNYLSPGVDETYTEGLAFLKARGFVEIARVENLRVPYAENPALDIPRALALIDTALVRGYRIARPTEHEISTVLTFIGSEFAQVWAKEAAMAYAGPRSALFCAFHEAGHPVAFAAADGNNQGLGWFGPAGTEAIHRGKGLGECLLVQCLLAVQGLPEAGVIAWIGPKAFYERSVAAKTDRRFVSLERAA